jgi:hypothetical protein
LQRFSLFISVVKERVWLLPVEDFLIARAKDTIFGISVFRVTGRGVYVTCNPQSFSAAQQLLYY